MSIKSEAKKMNILGDKLPGLIKRIAIPASIALLYMKSVFRHHTE